MKYEEKKKKTKKQRDYLILPIFYIHLKLIENIY